MDSKNFSHVKWKYQYQNKLLTPHIFLPGTVRS